HGGVSRGAGEPLSKFILHLPSYSYEFLVHNAVMAVHGVVRPNGGTFPTPHVCQKNLLGHKCPSGFLNSLYTLGRIGTFDPIYRSTVAFQSAYCDFLLHDI
ncbi:hypothetical protein ACJX0J_041467, partial [Zea mays]